VSGINKYIIYFIVISVIIAGCVKSQTTNIKTNENYEVPHEVSSNYIDLGDISGLTSTDYQVNLYDTLWSLKIMKYLDIKIPETQKKKILNKMEQLNILEAKTNEIGLELHPLERIELYVDIFDTLGVDIESSKRNTIIDYLKKDITNDGLDPAFKEQTLLEIYKILNIDYDLEIQKNGDETINFFYKSSLVRKLDESETEELKNFNLKDKNYEFYELITKTYQLKRALEYNGINQVVPIDPEIKLNDLKLNDLLYVNSQALFRLMYINDLVESMTNEDKSFVAKFYKESFKDWGWGPGVFLIDPSNTFSALEILSNENGLDYINLKGINNFIIGQLDPYLRKNKLELSDLLNLRSIIKSLSIIKNDNYSDEISKILKKKIASINQEINQGNSLEYKEVSLLVENILLLKNEDLLKDFSQQTKEKISLILKDDFIDTTILPGYFDRYLLMVASGTLSKKEKSLIVSDLFEYQTKDGGFKHNINDNKSRVESTIVATQLFGFLGITESESNIKIKSLRKYLKDQLKHKESTNNLVLYGQLSSSLKYINGR
jgi:hypothetical protein